MYAGDETLQDSGYESLPVGEVSTADRAARCKSLARTEGCSFYARGCNFRRKGPPVERAPTDSLPPFTTAEPLPRLSNNETLLPPVTTRSWTRRNSRRGLDHHRDQRARGGERGRRDGPVLGLRKGQELALEPGPQDWFRQGQCSCLHFDGATSIVLYRSSSVARTEIAQVTCQRPEGSSVAATRHQIPIIPATGHRS